MLESQMQMYYKVFPDKEKFECLTPEVYVYHNFLSKEECQSYIKEVESLQTTDSRMYEIESLSLLTKKVESALIGNSNSIFEWVRETGVSVDSFSYIKKMYVGDGMLPHNDVYGWKSRLFEGVIPFTDNHDQSSILTSAAWSTLLYFNDDYEGGEIEYLDNNLLYKPQAGDLLIHAVEAIHGVRKVISGVRYSSQSNINQNFCFNKSFIDNFRWPGSKDSLEFFDKAVQGSIYDEDSDWQYGIHAKEIVNSRLKKYKESNSIDWSLYGMNEEVYLNKPDYVENIT